MAEEPLRALAGSIRRAGLREPAAMLLDMLSPLDLISTQLARFSQPLVGGTSAEPLVRALGEAAGWAELRRLLGPQD